MIDLHIHTTNSDGAYTTTQVLARVRELKLKAISITDHDTLAAYDELPADPGVEIVPGIELSAFYGSKLVHLLGYFFDVPVSRVPCAVSPDREERGTQDEELAQRDQGHWDGLADYLARARKRTQDTVRHICDHLREKEGIPVSYEELVEKGADKPTLALLALRLLTRGHAKNWREVGAVWGRIHRELENSYPPPSVEEGIGVLREAKALVVIAHPGSLPMDGAKLGEGAIKELTALGLQGLEVYHKRHKPADVEFYRGLAAQLSLATSGGSDAHCRGKQPEIGVVPVDDAILDKMREHHTKGYGA